MANTLKIKRSSNAGSTPSASDLEHGEIAVNIADGKLFLKKSDNSIVAINNDTNNLMKSSLTKDNNSLETLRLFTFS